MSQQSRFITPGRQPNFSSQSRPQQRQFSTPQQRQTFQCQQQFQNNRSNLPPRPNQTLNFNCANNERQPSHDYFELNNNGQSNHDQNYYNQNNFYADNETPSNNDDPEIHNNNLFYNAHNDYVTFASTDTTHYCDDSMDYYHLDHRSDYPDHPDNSATHQTFYDDDWVNDGSNDNNDMFFNDYDGETRDL